MKSAEHEHVGGPIIDSLDERRATRTGHSMATPLQSEHVGPPSGGDPHRSEAESGTTFLSEAGRTLASSLDYEATLRQVARLAVPTIADWCVIDILEEETGDLRRLAVAHVDPEKVRFALELGRRYPPRPDQPIGPPPCRTYGRTRAGVGDQRRSP